MFNLLTCVQQLWKPPSASASAGGNATGASGRESMTTRFRKRPVVVEAFRMTEEVRDDFDAWPDWLTAAWQKHWPLAGAVGPLHGPDAPDRRVQVQSRSGVHVVSWGDWIVMQSPEDIYPVDHGVFETLYEDAAETAFEAHNGPSMIANGLTFSAALQMLHAGLRIARKGWNGNGQWVAMYSPDAGSVMDRPFIFISPVDGNRVPWVASQTDILADDWCVFAD